MSSANDKQHGGSHYKTRIEHWDYVVANEIPYLEAQVIKYLTRWRKKGGKLDVLKAYHFLQKLMEVEGITDKTVPTMQLVQDGHGYGHFIESPPVEAPGCFHDSEEQELNSRTYDRVRDRATMGGSARRTKSQVLRQRRDNPGGAGCCDRYADNMTCDCYATAVDDLRGMSLEEFDKLNAASRCSVCRDPDCNNPNGQH